MNEQTTNEFCDTVTVNCCRKLYKENITALKALGQTVRNGGNCLVIRRAAQRALS